MCGYDAFSKVYDLMLERHYAPQHRIATEALALRPNSVVLDAPCGTGQAFAPIVQALGPEGRLIGVDLSEGMLAAAGKRVAREGWTQVSLVKADAGRVRLADLPARPDRLHVFLGTTVFPDPDAVLTHLWELLAPGGLAVVVDVHNPSPGLQGKIVERMAQADLRRRAWEILERLAGSIERTTIANRGSDGGPMWMAVARKR